MTGGKYIGCSDCGGGLFTVTAASLETVKFKRDGDSLIPDVRKTQYADGGYDSVDCQNCGNNFNIDDLEPEGE